MSIKVQGQVVITDDKKGLFEQVNPGSYTTAQRDALTPAIGDIVFNSEADELQVWDGTEWGSAGSGTNGVIQPEVEVLTPLDRAGDPELTYLKTDRIVAVETDGGTLSYETDTIQSVLNTGAVVPWQPSDGYIPGPPVTSTDIQFADVLAARGVTHITGINMYSDGAGGYDYTAELEGLWLNGAQMHNTNGRITNIVITQGVPYNNGYAYETFFSSSGSSAQGGTLAGYNCTFDAKELGTDARIRFTTSGGRVSVLDQNGVEHFILGDEQDTLTFPTSNNFDKFAVGEKTEGPTTFNPDSGANTGVGALSSDNLTISAGSSSYVERSSFAPVFVNNTYSEFTMSGSVVGGVGIGDSAARVISGAGQYVVYREYGAIIKYPGNLTVTTTAGFGDGDVIGVQADATTNTLSFFKNGTLQASFEINQYSFTGDLFAHAALIPNSDCSITANFGASPYQTAAAAGYEDLSAGSNILAIDSDANTITVDGGKWVDPAGPDYSQEWSSYGTGTSWPDRNWDKAFNGVITTDSDLAAFAGTSSTMTWTPTTPIPVTSEVTIYLTQDGGLAINGSYILPDNTPANATYGEAYIYSAAKVGGTLTSISITTSSSNVGPYVTAVAVDGVLLVDASQGAGRQDKISKTLIYDTQLTLEGSTDLALMATGPAVMTDGVLGGSGYSQTPYTLTTTDIESINDTDPANIVLTFPGDVSTNPDLRYFQAGDVAQSEWNQSQTWSTYGTFTGDFASVYTWVNVFSQHLDTGTTGAMYLNSGIATWTLTAPLACSSSVTFKQVGSTSYTINAGLPGETTGVSSGSDDLTISFTGDIQNIHVNTTGTYIMRMFVDGKALIDPQYTDPSVVTVISTDLAANTMTVDGGQWGVYNDSQVWSNSVTSPSGFQAGQEPSGGFDGSTDTYAGAANLDDPLTFTPATPITYTTSVEIYTAQAGTASLNGVSVATPDAVAWVTLASGYSGTINSIVVDAQGDRRSTFTAIRVDGLLLVDTGAGFSDNRVQALSPGGTGDIVQINASNNTMLLSNSNNRWISNNKAGTAFSVAAGSLANPPAPDYLDIAFTSMNAGTTPFTGISATLSSRTWTLETASSKAGPWSLVDTYQDFDMTASQDGATPWTTNKPVLLQSTWYRVKVTYNSTNSDSVESVYHTFKTGV